MVISAYGGTDVGRKRGHNEDSFGVFDENGLYVVADGMGGHAAGEVASGAAVEVLKNFVAATAAEDDITWPFEREQGLSRGANRLVVGIKLANQVIFDRAHERQELKGMGTTVVAAMTEGGYLHVAHVGDSRAYIFRGGALRRITSDHSYVEEMVKAGQLTPEQARIHPFRNVVTRALGTRPEVRVDLSRQTPEAGDIYMLCSDGLTGMLTDAEMEKIISGHASSPSACVQALIDAANGRGGDDNITVVLLKAA